MLKKSLLCQCTRKANAVSCVCAAQVIPCFNPPSIWQFLVGLYLDGCHVYSLRQNRSISLSSRPWQRRKPVRKQCTQSLGISV